MTSLPDRSSTEAIAGAPGPVTTISLTFIRVGLLKSTCFCSSGLTVTCAATRSTLPSRSAEPSTSRGSGTKNDVHLVVDAGLEVLVQPFLDELPVVVRHTALYALVDEVERAIERDADPHEPPLDHLVEVARERLQDGLAHGGRQLGFELGGRERGLFLGRLRRFCGRLPAAGRERHYDANEQNSSQLDLCTQDLLPRAACMDRSWPPRMNMNTMVKHELLRHAA